LFLAWQSQCSQSGPHEHSVTGLPQHASGHISTASATKSSGPNSVGFTASPTRL